MSGEGRREACGRRRSRRDGATGQAGGSMEEEAGGQTHFDAHAHRRRWQSKGRTMMQGEEQQHGRNACPLLRQLATHPLA